MVRVLVTGVSGFIGSFAYEHLKNVYDAVGTGRTEGERIGYVADITKPQEVDRMILEASPDVVVHCAKISKSVDYCEEKKEECHLVNTLGTRYLVDAVKKHSPEAKFIFLSTDYVYDGRKGGYTEKDPTNPLNCYGRSKLEAEGFVKTLPDHLVLRTTVVFGYHPGGKNFFMQLLEKQRKKEEMRVPVDQIGNPTYIHLLTEIIERSIKEDVRGLYIATGSEAMSRYEFSIRIADRLGFDKNLIIGAETKDLNQTAPRPLNCSLIPGKIQKDLGYLFPSLDESLKHLKNEVHSRRPKT